MSLYVSFLRVLEVKIRIKCQIVKEPVFRKKVWCVGRDTKFYTLFLRPSLLSNS